MERTKWPGIYRRGESWVAVVGYSARGRRRQKWITAPTLKETQRRRRDFLESLDRGVRPQDATMMVSDLATSWLDDLRAMGRRDATLRRYRKVLKNHILPAFGDTRLKDLERDELRAFERDHVGDYNVLSALLGYAVKDKGILAINPCSAIRRTRLPRREAPHLDAPEARRMLELVRGERLEGAVVLGLVGGLRLAEVCGLRWRDVDGDRVYVRGSYYGPTKSGEPRSLTMPADAMVALRRYKMRQAEELLRLGVRQEEETPVVATWDVNPMNPCTLSEHFKNFTTTHGFAVTFHGLRHSAAIAMLSSGVDVKTAASRLGHSPRVLLATYAHHVRSADEAAAVKLGEWLNG
jgi:integrase